MISEPKTKRKYVWVYSSRGFSNCVDAVYWFPTHSDPLHVLINRYGAKGSEERACPTMAERRFRRLSPNSKSLRESVVEGPITRAYHTVKAMQTSVIDC